MEVNKVSKDIFAFSDRPKWPPFVSLSQSHHEHVLSVSAPALLDRAQTVCI